MRHQVIVADPNKREPAPEIVYAVSPLKYLKVIRPKTSVKTILSIDGGGVRGLIPAVELEYLELAIKEAIVNGRSQLEVAEDSELKTIPDKASNFYIQLADYFEVVAGTSTGALLATYLASKGGEYDAFPDGTIDPDLEQVLANLPTEAEGPNGTRDAAYWRERYSAATLHKGTAASAQALYISKANKIFPKIDFKDVKALDEVLPPEKELNALLTKIKARLLPPARWNQPGQWVLNRLAEFYLGKDWNKAALEHKLGELEPSLREELLTKAWGVFRAKHRDAGLQATLQQVLGERNLRGPGLHTSLVVQSFELDYNRPFTFWYDSVQQESGYATLSRALTEQEKEESVMLTLPPPVAKKDVRWVPDFTFIPGVDVKLADVVRASTAAPTFLPAAKVTLGYKPKGQEAFIEIVRQFCDGGVCANNPALVAIAFALIALDEKGKQPVKIQDIATLSFGTGQTVSPMSLSNTDAGAFQWVVEGDGRLMNILMNGPPAIQTAVGELMLFEELGVNELQFLRVQTTAINIPGSSDATPERRLTSGRLPSEVLNKMDDSSAIWDLLEIGERSLAAGDHWPLLKGFVEQNLFNTKQ